MKSLLAIVAFLALLIVAGLTGCSSTTSAVIPPALLVPTLEVTTVTSDVNHGTRVDVTVSNPTDQTIQGVIVALEQSATRNVDVTLWYGFNDQTIFKTVLVTPGQRYHPGLSVVCRDGVNWTPLNDDIFGEDGFIIGDLAPHETVETRSWFITF